MASRRTPGFEAIIARLRVIEEASGPLVLIDVTHVFVASRAKIPHCS